MTTTAAAAGTRRHTGTHPAEPRQVGLARAALAGGLGGCPQADEAILEASEFATNSVLHSASRQGGAFTLRAEVSRDRLRSRWRTPEGRGVMGRGMTGGRMGSMPWPRSPGRGTGASTGTPGGASPGLGSAGEIRMAVLPPPADAARVSRFLADHLGWSAYWDKKYGLWRVAEDDPDSDLYAESSDADTVISYIAAHS